MAGMQRGSRPARARSSPGTDGHTAPTQLDVDMSGYLQEDIDPEEVARAWLEANLPAVKGWVEGVTTATGDPAEAALEAAFGSAAQE